MSALLAPSLPPTGYRVEMPTLTAPQREVFDCPARFRVAFWGRGCGKSWEAYIECWRAATEQPGAEVWYLNGTAPMVRQQWREFMALWPTIPGRYNRTELRAELANGSSIHFRSAEEGEGRLRGGQRRLIVCDEFASWPDGQNLWQKALRPALTRYGGRALFVGTPRGRNWAAALYDHARSGLDPEWAAFHHPSRCNPFLPLGDIEQARRDLPERVFQQEYLAAVLEDGGAVLRRVKEAVYGPAPEPYKGAFVMGVDWGKREDFTVFTVLDVATGRVVCVDRMNQIDYRLQTSRLRVLAEAWNVGSILVEQNAMGDPLLETLQREGLPATGFVTSNTSKARIIDALAVAFERGELGLPDDPILVAECQAYTVERLPGGSFRYSAPPGMHDDCVMSLALALEAAGSATYTGGWV